LPNVAIGFSIRHTGASHYNIPQVLGLSTPREVHECIKVWREINEGNGADREKYEELIRKKFEDAGFKDWSWASP
jgi:D-arabinose 1-dehydrogenase